MKDKVYINGEELEQSQAGVELSNRGHQFGDGVYEVVAVWDGAPLKLEAHMERLENSARAIDIDLPSAEWFIDEARSYLANAGCLNKGSGQNVKLYVQVSRGTCPRHHAYPDNLDPEIMMNISDIEPYPQEYFSQGVEVITYPDRRWARCNIKSLQLLPNVMARKAAEKSDVFEAIFVRDGYAMEGAISNYFIVEGNELITPPASNYILNGITRRTIMELAEENNYIVREESIELERFLSAQELFLTGTTTEVMPVVQVDEHIIGDGTPGEITQDILDFYWRLSRPNYS